MQNYNLEKFTDHFLYFFLVNMICLGAVPLIMIFHISIAWHGGIGHFDASTFLSYFEFTLGYMAFVLLCNLTWIILAIYTGSGFYKRKLQPIKI